MASSMAPSNRARRARSKPALELGEDVWDAAPADARTARQKAHPNQAGRGVTRGLYGVGSRPDPVGMARLYGYLENRSKISTSSFSCFFRSTSPLAAPSFTQLSTWYLKTTRLMRF